MKKVIFSVVLSASLLTQAVLANVENAAPIQVPQVPAQNPAPVAPVVPPTNSDSTIQPVQPAPTNQTETKEEPGFVTRILNKLSQSPADVKNFVVEHKLSLGLTTGTVVVLYAMYKTCPAFQEFVDSFRGKEDESEETDSYEAATRNVVNTNRVY